MSRWPSRIHRWAESRKRMRAVAVAAVLALLTGLLAPAAEAAPVLAGGQVPAVKMYGYAAGPKQHVGSAAGRAHYVPASATQARVGTGTAKGHPAPGPRPGTASGRHESARDDRRGTDASRARGNPSQGRHPSTRLVTVGLRVAYTLPIADTDPDTAGEPVSGTIVLRHRNHDGPAQRGRNRQRLLQCRVDL